MLLGALLGAVLSGVSRGVAVNDVDSTCAQALLGTRVSGNGTQERSQDGGPGSAPERGVAVNDVDLACAQAVLGTPV